jgi:hypothetical protein
MGKGILGLVFCGGVMMSGLGCQLAPPAVSVKRLAEHREVVDLGGLQPTQILQDLKVSWSVPGQWEALPVKKTLLYTHQQWRSPTLSTGVGVAHIQLPVPVPAQAVLWFAKSQYTTGVTDPKDGKLINEWTDSLGRQWFEAQNSKYHVKGYAITQGKEAWIVYCGYRMSREPVPKEIALAEKSLDSVVPTN